MFSQLIWMINFAVQLEKKGANCLPIEMVSWDVVDAQCIIAVIVVGWFFGFVRQNRHTFCFAAWFNSGTWLESFANNLASLFLQLLFCLSDTQMPLQTLFHCTQSAATCLLNLHRTNITTTFTVCSYLCWCCCCCCFLFSYYLYIFFDSLSLSLSNSEDRRWQFEAGIFFGIGMLQNSNSKNYG